MRVLCAGLLACSVSVLLVAWAWASFVSLILLVTVLPMYFQNFQPATCTIIAPSKIHQETIWCIQCKVTYKLDNEEKSGTQYVKYNLGNPGMGCMAVEPSEAVLTEYCPEGEARECSYRKGELFWGNIHDYQRSHLTELGFSAFTLVGDVCMVVAYCIGGYFWRRIQARQVRTVPVEQKMREKQTLILTET